MSFTKEVKTEICKLKCSKLENIAELSAFFRSNVKYTENHIELITENAKVARRMYTHIKELYGVESIVEEKPNAVFTKSMMYIIKIKDQIQTILQDLSVIDDNNQLLEMPNEYIVGSTEESKAYIRGAFLAKGSINDPKTSIYYHLEFVFDHKKEAVFVQRLLNDFDLNSKILLRESKCMVYIKDSEEISDLLKVISAMNSVLYYENVRAYRDKKNATNRLNNCEQANVDKIIQTAANQVECIEHIQRLVGLEVLDDKIRQAAEYRLKYPEVSLLELSEIISLETNTRITKSGLNHRLRKLKEIAKKLKLH